MHVMKRAVQALCVATSLPWGVATAAIGRRNASSIRVGGSVVAAVRKGRALTPASSVSAGRSSLIAFAPTAFVSTSGLNHRPIATAHRNRISSQLRMSSSNQSNIQQTKNRVALLQLPVTPTKSQNLQTATNYIYQARDAGARLCVLPEIWNSPYATSAFREYAEVLPEVGDSLSSQSSGESESEWGESAIMLMEIAKSTNMYIVGGSVPEIVPSNDRIYNTCLVVNPSGTIVGKHRKVHLFDVNVPGGIQFRESETLTGGEGVTYFDVDDEEEEGGLGRIGVGICYDIRFPEYALLLTQTHSCKILIYPGAFNLTTGPAHWELLQRARAVDGQCYVLTASPARMPPPKEEEESKYPHYSAWGHSTVVSPWGEVVATCDEKPGMVVADLDMGKVEEMRMAIPTMGQKRNDLYRLVNGDADIDMK